MRSGLNKTSEILSNEIVKLLDGYIFPLGVFFYLQFQCDIWGLMNLSVYSVMLQYSDKLEIFFFLTSVQKRRKELMEHVLSSTKNFIHNKCHYFNHANSKVFSFCQTH